MSQRFRHPSAEIPPFAAFELELPDGWRADEAPDCLAVFFDPAATGFRTNLLVSADRVDASVDLEQAAQDTLADAAAFADFRVEREKVDEIGGQPASLRYQSFTVEGVPDRLLQLQVLLFSPPGGRTKTRDLFHIDGTCLGRDTETYAGVFLDIARSFTFLD
ncbi:hypothetical protein DVA67_022810 [Solirubrobacter sp. CPCC 204708]|uniref:DUF1795 domain-containing protein n=1 Tax=Solirubrobacter deserti TaxID=2282478 RepID=A0ABT4RIT0_9ACTN|nr:DcrB-related protein [Solirubrobacter deserti]MBE2318825.1 hypothetical protein [Solirubrobacter deserti]MDA0138205.1 DUF1795 domain-containing protein [Solirubrobacter deserti]